MNSRLQVRGRGRKDYWLPAFAFITIVPLNPTNDSNETGVKVFHFIDIVPEAQIIK